LLQGDAGVTRELEGYEVERFRQMGRHLDLMWNVGKVQLCMLLPSWTTARQACSAM
jgi:hypothetical protein